MIIKRVRFDYQSMRLAFVALNMVFVVGGDRVWTGSHTHDLFAGARRRLAHVRHMVVRVQT